MTSLASYRHLTKRDFALSKVAAFGLVSHQKVILAKRPVTRRFTLLGRRAAYFDVSFVVDAASAVRDAVDLKVTYRSGFSGRSFGTDGLQLFADADTSPRRRQRIWLCPPRGARFADVAFASRLRGHRVALDGLLQLATNQPKPTLAHIDRLLRTHDLSAMTLLLKEAEAARDRENGQRLLARMQQLSHSHDIFSAVANLRDAVNFEQYGVVAPAGRGLELPENPGRSYCYDRWVSPTTAAVLPAGKQVRSELFTLHERLCSAEASELELEAGDMMLARLLVTAMLKAANPALKVRIDWEAFREKPQHFGPWLGYDSGASFLATNGGQAVQSILMSDF